MQKFLFALSLMAAAAAFPAEATNESGTTTRTIQVGAFDELDVSVFDVEVRIGAPTGKVDVTVSDKYAGHLDVRNDKGTLKIGFRKGINISKDKMVAKAVLTVPTLKEIEGDAAANINVLGSLRASEFDVDLSSAACLTVPDIIADTKLSIEMSSAANLSLTKASAPEVDIDLSSSAHCTIGTLRATDTEIDASSSASVTVSGGSTDVIDIDASSSANVNTKNFVAGRGSADASSMAKVNATITSPSRVNSSSGGSVSLK